MEFAFIIVGLVLFIIGLGSVIASYFPLPSKMKEQFPSFLTAGWKSFVPFLIGAFFFIQVVPSSMFYANQGKQYYIIYPTGAKNAIFEQGYKFVLPFSKVQEWEKYIDIKTLAPGESEEGIEGPIRGGIPVRFIDQVTAETYVSVRVQLPTDKESFIALAEKFRHPKNLINNTLIPTIQEQTANNTYMFTGQDYISGSASDYRLELDDQLKNGGFSVEKFEHMDTIRTTLHDTIPTINEIRTRYEVVKREDENGSFIRIPHDITESNVRIDQVIVQSVVMDSAFTKRLEKQRDLASQQRIELEQVQLASIEQQRVVAKGEVQKAEMRVKLEISEVEQVVAAENALEVARTDQETMKVQAQTAKIEAQKRRTLAEVKRYEIEAADGLSEEARYRIDAEKEAQIEIAKAIGGPKGLYGNISTMINGSGSGQESMSPADALILQMFSQNANKK